MERIPITRVANMAAAMSLSLIAAVIFFRRVFGNHLTELVVGESAFYAACFTTLAVTFARNLIQETNGSLPARITPIASALVILMFVAGLSAEPLTLLIALIAAGGMGLLTGLVFAREPFRHLVQNVSRGSSPAESGVSWPQMEELADVDEELSEPPRQFEAYTTRRCDNGLAVIEGYLVFKLSASETIKVLHFPIWPPLPAPPAVQTTLDGFSGRIRVTLSKTYGFRIEVRRTAQGDETVEGVLHFIAESPEVRAAA